MLSGQQAVSVLSDDGLCATVLLGIFAAATFLLSFPRTLARLSWLGLISAVFITLCAILAMIGAGANPIPNRIVVATVPTNFYEAFLAITGPVSVPFRSSQIGSYIPLPLQVFAYAGHFMYACTCP